MARIMLLIALLFAVGCKDEPKPNPDLKVPVPSVATRLMEGFTDDRQKALDRSVALVEMLAHRLRGEVAALTVRHRELEG